MSAIDRSATVTRNFYCETRGKFIRMFYEDEDEVMSDAGGREEMSPDRVGEEEEEEKVQSPE